MLKTSPLYPTSSEPEAKSRILALIPVGQKNKFTALLGCYRNSIIKELQSQDNSPK